MVEKKEGGDVVENKDGGYVVEEKEDWGVVKRRLRDRKEGWNKLRMRMGMV